jgi:hypothetical protein
LDEYDHGWKGGLRMNHPLLYEINTRCWLTDLSRAAGKPVTLADVPEREFLDWRRLGFTHLWLMGVWNTGPRALAEARNTPELRYAYDHILPGWTPKDVGGSPYSISDYQVPAAMGGDDGLARFRANLHRHGMKLILDFVPNHLGVDHAWLRERPELFVQSPQPRDGVILMETILGPRWIALGKDPYFPPWTDVVQMDYRRLDTRSAMQALLCSVAARCDGVRCDMAMLLLNDVFARTWSHLPPTAPVAPGEFWPAAIDRVRCDHPGFVFLAEVYWDLEAMMQSLGFDFTYDKHLYDDLIWSRGSAAQHRLLGMTPRFMAACAHFIENHDEPRVADNLSVEAHRAAALAVLGLPGMRFVHEGQLAGARIKIPVQLSRRPTEPVQPEIAAMYEAMLGALQTSSVGSGVGQVLQPRSAWAGNPTHENFIIVFWQRDPAAFDLVVVNLAPHPGQCFVPLPVKDIAKHDWCIRDCLGRDKFTRSGTELEKQGLYLDVPAHAAQLFRFTHA